MQRADDDEQMGLACTGLTATGTVSMLSTCIRCSLCMCVFVLVSCHCHRSAYVCCLLSAVCRLLSVLPACPWLSVACLLDSFHIAADVMLLPLSLLLLLLLFPCLASSLQHCQRLNCHKPGIGRICKYMKSARQESRCWPSSKLPNC